MRRRLPRLRFVLLGLALIGLSACASRGARVPEPPVRSVAIVPVLPPTSLGYERNDGTRSRDTDAERLDFQQAFEATRLRIGERMTAALIAAVEARGLRATVAERVHESRDDEPEDLAYDRMGGDADVVLHVVVKEAGVYADRVTVNFEPDVETTGIVVSKRTGQELFNDDFVYGARADARSATDVRTPQRYLFGQYEDLLRRPKLVEDGIDAGLVPLARAIVDRVAKLR